MLSIIKFLDTIAQISESPKPRGLPKRFPANSDRFHTNPAGHAIKVINHKFIQVLDDG